MAVVLVAEFVTGDGPGTLWNRRLCWNENHFQTRHVHLHVCLSKSTSRFDVALNGEHFDSKLSPYRGWGCLYESARFPNPRVTEPTVLGHSQLDEKFKG